MMRKRGQVLGQPFIMIFAMVVGALILIWGVYQIAQLGEVGAKAKLMDEVSDFRKEINAYYVLEEGNSKKIKLSLPSKIKNICFYYDHESWKPATSPPISNNYPSDLKDYKTVMQANTDKHVFFFPAMAYKDTQHVTVPHIRPKDYDPLCIRNSQEIRITSKGDHVEISLP